ncbi:hypothetical protein CANCADRAFT_12813, partial [Tortispora caseinolytica NRRL Y-17796]
AAEQRRLLEQLMGSNNDVSKLSLNSSELCPYYLVGECVYDLFQSTKMELGQCPRIHSKSHKEQFAKLPRNDPLVRRIEYEYLNMAHKYIADSNRRRDIMQRRLEKTPEEVIKTKSLVSQLEAFEAEEQALLEEAAVFGEIGQIDRVLDLITEANQNAKTRDSLEHQLRLLQEKSGTSGSQKLHTCHICSGYLSTLDHETRLLGHFTGKLHRGMAYLRQTEDRL